MHEFRNISQMQLHVDQQFRRHLALVENCERSAEADPQEDGRRSSEFKDPLRPNVAASKRRKVIMTISRSLDPISESQLRKYDAVSRVFYASLSF